MTSDIWTLLMAALLWFSLIAYALFGGPDFGAGFWDLFAYGKNAEAQNGAIIQAIGPVWEANNIWLIFLVTGTFTAFPIVFATVSTVLIIPLIVALLGVVLRGAAFAYYSHFSKSVKVNPVWGRVFSGASVIAPVFFGAAAAAIASGSIRVTNGVIHADYWTTWLNPFGILCGLFALGICAVLAASYLTVETQRNQRLDLLRLYRRRALISGVVVAVIGVLALFATRYQAPYLFDNLFGKALPILIASVVGGLATAIVLLRRHYYIARSLLIASVVLILAAWAYAQAPDLIVPDVTLANAAAPSNVEALLFVSSLVGLAIVVPSLAYLLHVFKGTQPAPSLVAADLAKSPPPAPSLARPAPPPEVIRRELVGTLRLAGAATLSIALVVVARIWRGLPRAAIRRERRHQRHSLTHER